MGNEITTTDQARQVALTTKRHACALSEMVPHTIKSIFNGRTAEWDSEVPEVSEVDRALLPAIIETAGGSLTKSQPDSITKALATLEGAFPSARVADNVAAVQMAAYAEALEDMPADLLSVAVKRAIARLRFYPKPAELFDLVKTEISERHAIQNKAAYLKQLLEREEKRKEHDAKMRAANMVAIERTGH